VSAGVQHLVVGIVVVLLMLSAGLRVDGRALLGALARRRHLARVLAANLLAVPLVAAALARGAGLAPAAAGAVLLCAIAPGGAFAPVLAGLARADVETSVGLMLVLALSGVATAPAGVALLGLADVGLGPGTVLQTVLTYQVAPLAVGLTLGTLAPAAARALAPPVGTLASGALVAVVAWLVVLRGHVLVATGLGALGCMAVVVAVSLALGRVTGGRVPVARAAALCTAVRNLALALLVASLPGAAPGLDAGVLAFAAVMLATSALAAVGWRCAEQRERAGARVAA
jgi:BASS family bile acid:Na+ symporter